MNNKKNWTLEFPFGIQQMMPTLTFSDQVEMNEPKKQLVVERNGISDLLFYFWFSSNLLLSFSFELLYCSSDIWIMTTSQTIYETQYTTVLTHKSWKIVEIYEKNANYLENLARIKKSGSLAAFTEDKKDEKIKRIVNKAELWI